MDMDSSSEDNSDSSLRKAPRRIDQDLDDDAVRSALHFAVGRVCHEEESGQGAKMTSEAIAALTELTYQYATTSLALDLVSFSSHANRRTISVDDVKLVLRKDPDGLLANLEHFCESRGLGSSGFRAKQGKGTSATKYQKGKIGGGTLLQAFEKSTTLAGTGLSESLRDQHNEQSCKRTERSSSSESSETSFKLFNSLEKSENEMTFGSCSDSNLAMSKTASRQRDEQNQSVATSSDGSDNEPFMDSRKPRQRLKGKQRKKKTIDLTED